MDMFRKFSIVVAALSILWGSAAAESQQVLLDRAKSLLEHGRYADARHEYMRLKLDSKAANEDIVQQVEYGLTVCAVRLDDNIAEQRMKSFLTRYPGLYTRQMSVSSWRYTTVRLSSGQRQRRSLRRCLTSRLQRLIVSVTT